MMLPKFLLAAQCILLPKARENFSAWSTARSWIYLGNGKTRKMQKTAGSSLPRTPGLGYFSAACFMQKTLFSKENLPRQTPTESCFSTYHAL
jgi:hypothetical protein